MAKKAAYGTRLIFTDPETSDVRRICYVADISGPEVSVETIDVTTHCSPDNFNEFIPGQADGGEVTFDLIFDPDTDGHSRILELVDLRLPVDFTLSMPREDSNFISNSTFPNGTGWTQGGLWSITGGNATLSVSGPDGSDSLATSVTGLLIGETYKARITTTAGSSSGTLQIKLALSLVATVVILPGRVNEFSFVATAASGVLEFVAPASVDVVAFIIDAIQVSGFETTPGNSFDFTGLFTKAGAKFAVKDAVKSSVGIKVSGKPVFTEPV